MAPAESSSPTGEYRSLNPDRIVDTIARLRDRIRDRFPSAGLLGVANTLLTVAKDHARRSVEIRKPILFLRAASAVLLVAECLAGFVVQHLNLGEFGRYTDLFLAL